MAEPKIKIVAISNVYTRLMHFQNKGDVEIGHIHTYDHATMVSSGSILYEVLDSQDGNTIAKKEFKAPGYVFVDKDKYHRLTALEDNTICVCIHAMRSIDQNIIPPDILIEPIHSISNGFDVEDKLKELTNINLESFIVCHNEIAQNNYDHIKWNEPN